MAVLKILNSFWCQITYHFEAPEVSFPSQLESLKNFTCSLRYDQNSVHSQKFSIQPQMLQIAPSSSKIFIIET